MEFARVGGCQWFRGWDKRTFLRLSESKNRLPTEPVAQLLADAELRDDGFIPFRVVLLQIVQQATSLADQHEKSAARAVVFLVRFEMLRQLTDALAQQRDLNFRTSRIGGVRAIGVNDGLFLLSG